MCTDGICEQCADGYSFNFQRTLCCSIGCKSDQYGYPVCLENENCFYNGCQLGFYGRKCHRCTDKITHCATCYEVTPDGAVMCTKCANNKYLNDDLTQCCINQGCDQYTGECEAGWYGTTCESRCPGNSCLNNTCDHQLGTCDSGCLPNYYGVNCTEVCQCIQAGTMTCEQNKGTCVCKPGFSGELCSEHCSVGCLGLTCAKDGSCSSGC
ncbi:TENX-like protein [Mya arenaria]|uniref:TENX-like protein n=2 Tax=Mya arenaria TaxID=6604 RepID=A0ABY7GAH0_MYAAR|nr:TENX-like protein [Mya arenaria]